MESLSSNAPLPGNAGVEQEVKDIQYNIPELFID